MEFTHVILTRFSVRVARAAPPAPVGWLEYRLGLFETFCLPGLARQTSPAFSWLVLCDDTTDLACVQHLRALRNTVPQLEVVMTSPERDDVAALVSRSQPHDRLLITTRVDSDDASSFDLVERIQAHALPFAASGHVAALLNFSRGFKLDARSDTVYETWHPHSPHLTLFERLDVGRAPVTVQTGNHGFMQDAYPLHIDAGPPTWVQVIHGGNVSNDFLREDAEVEASVLADRFVLGSLAGISEAVPAPQPETPEDRTAFRQALEEAVLPHEDVLPHGARPGR